MDMPIMHGLADAAAGAPNALADLLGTLAPEDVAALDVAATTAQANGDLQPQDPAAPDDPGGTEEADESAEPDPEAQAEADAKAAAATAQQYCDAVDASAASVGDLKSRIEALAEGADEHKKQGIDTGPVDDAIDAVAAAEEAVTAAQDDAKAAADGDEPDLEAGAQAVQDAQAAFAAAQEAVTAAEESLKSDVADADDPDLAAMRAWADSMGLSTGSGPMPMG